MALVEWRRKFVVLGAYNCGNVGDDMYKYVFSDHIRAELVFDHPPYDVSNLRGADGVIVGGGGLIYDNSTEHFFHLNSFLEATREAGLPWCFLSVGVQYVQPSWQSKEIVRWKKWLEGAKVVTARSQACAEAMREVAPAADVHEVRDAGYLLTPSAYGVIPPGKHVEVIRGKRDQEQPEPDYLLVFSRDDEKLMGLWTCPRLFDLTPPEALRALVDARQVVTGRYHGYVLARAARAPVVNLDRRYKSVQEEKSAAWSLSELQEHAQRSFYLFNERFECR